MDATGTAPLPVAKLFLIVVASLLAGALAIAALVALGIELAPLRTISTIERAADGVVLRTTYNPAAIILLAALVAGAVVAIARTVEAVGPRLAAADARRDVPARQEAKVREAERSLSAELSKVLGLIRAHLAANDNYAQTLANAQSRLQSLKEAEQVRVIVSLLVAENQRMRVDATELKTKLEASKAHVEALRASLNAAEQQTMRDPLTGIGNRRAFDQALEKAHIEASAGHEALSLVMCDIDYFKKVNDTHGHVVGDEVLKMFARVLADNVREGDTVARYGGEEFGIIMKASQGGAIALAERVRQQFEAKRLTIRATNKQLGQLSASFGVAELRDNETAPSLIERADLKLYEAKKAGRNRVAAYEI